MTVQIKNFDELVSFFPNKIHLSDACFDIIAFSEPKIVGTLSDDIHYLLYSSIDYIEYRTSLFIKPPIGYFIDLRPRSSISKYNLILANSPATIDNEYRGEILVRFKYIAQPEDFVTSFRGVLLKINRDKIYLKGDKIAQIRLEKQEDFTFQVVDSLDDTIRGSGGFGSTGK